jgi:tetratricopeptide (TPR) repeat protein
MIDRRACVAGLGILLTAVVLPGCVSRGPLLSTAGTALPSRTELTDTEFFPQQEYHCGPAALATVLRHAQLQVSPDELVDLVYIPGRKGALQAEMLAAARRHHRIAYELPPDVDSLLEELSVGRPVVVLQNLGLKKIPAWHYAVLVGYDTDDDSVVLRSGNARRLRMPARRFLATWERSGRWAFVVLRANDVPAALDRRRWLEAIAALEQTAPPRDLELAYSAYLARFPNDDKGTLGLANARLALGKAGEAEKLYRELLMRQPQHVPARNNLAWSLSAQNCIDEALGQVDAAILDVDENDTFYRQALADTRLRISGMDRHSGRGCARPTD